MTPRIAALVRAIRRAHDRGRATVEDRKWAGAPVVAFRVDDVFAFAERLAAEGVTVKEPKTRRAA